MSFPPPRPPFPPLPPVVTLAPERVEVVRLDVGRAAAGAPRAERLLAPEERDRARAFRREQDRLRAVLGRALVREVLGRALDLDPAGIALRPGRHGKPELADPSPRVYFNVSHAAERVVLAVARDRAVGVDVEQLRADLDDRALARYAFAPGERAALASLSDAAHRAAFFQIWACKESYMKARGDGLSLALDAFEVEPGPDRPAALLSHAGEPDAPARWRMARLDLGTGYAAALTAEGDGWLPRCWDAEGW